MSRRRMQIRLQSDVFILGHGWGTWGESSQEQVSGF